ncbi:MAG TPA: septal ring lytic transglycosylase RlpA family protein [Candidatus Methylacidiphilales bacterium]
MKSRLLLAALPLLLAGCASDGTMTASWYGRENQHGPTASGQRFDMYDYTAAHKTLPMGTILSVRNPKTGKSVRVTVTDRGPFVHGRDLDLSYAAARDLGMIGAGVADLDIKKVGYDERYAKYWKHGQAPAVDRTTAKNEVN